LKSEKSEKLWGKLTAEQEMGGVLRVEKKQQTGLILLLHCTMVHSTATNLTHTDDPMSF